MFPRWLTFSAFLANLSNSQGAAADALRVKPTCGVKGRPEQQLTLKCGDGTNTGGVWYWHTPFGELRSPSFPSELDPVFTRPDRSLVIPNSSGVHGGLYYCLLQHTEGAALWPYELHIGHRHQSQKLSNYQQSLSFLRLSRDVASEKQNDLSHEVFAGAVAASVLLTFVFGFSIGALSRTHVLRFLGFVTKMLRSSRQQTDVVDSEFTVTSPPPKSQGFEMGNLQDDDSSTDTSYPPIKPQRSFRHKKEEERKTEEEGKSVEGKKKRCEEKEREGGENPNDTECRESTEDKDGGQSQEEDNKSNKDGGSEEKKTEDDEETKTAEDKDSLQPSTESGDRESDGRSQDSGIRDTSCPPCPARHCRVICLYQYDEDGQRYCHLPEPAPHNPAPVPVPRPRQRTRSLTRLSAIMAAASAGPLGRQEAVAEDEGTHFCMDI